MHNIVVYAFIMRHGPHISVQGFDSLVVIRVRGDMYIGTVYDLIEDLMVITTGMLIQSGNNVSRNSKRV